MNIERLETFGALILASAGTCASAQDFRLDLRLTHRTVSTQQILTDVQTGGTIFLRPGTYRIELRYRNADLTADTIDSGGLASVLINVRADGPGNSGSSFSKAMLTYNQADGAGPTFPLTIPDASGFGPDATGLIAPFRGALTADNDIPNGGATLSFPSFSILPLTLRPVGHNSYRCTNIECQPDLMFWGIFALNVNYSGRGKMTITASASQDPQTGNRFAFFTRTGNVTSPVPINSTLATDGVITIRPLCVGDYDGSGAITSQDVFTFLADWFANDPRADVNASDNVTVQDVFDFLTAWFSGCE